MNSQKYPGGTLEVNEPHFEFGCVGESEGIEVTNLEANRGLLRNVSVHRVGGCISRELGLLDLAVQWT